MSQKVTKTNNWILIEYYIIRKPWIKKIAERTELLQHFLYMRTSFTFELLLFLIGKQIHYIYPHKSLFTFLQIYLIN